MDHQVPPRRNSQLRTEYVAPSTLEPIPGAPRYHPKSQTRALAKSLRAFGQVLPILIDGDNRIISGLALWQVATEIGLAEVMVVRIDYLTEPQTKALMIALIRRDDPHDGRRVFIELAPATSQALRRYFAEVGQVVTI